MTRRGAWEENVLLERQEEKVLGYPRWLVGQVLVLEEAEVLPPEEKTTHDTLASAGGMASKCTAGSESLAD